MPATPRTPRRHAPGAIGRVGAATLAALALVTLAACGGDKADVGAATPENPRKVTVAGDSISVGLGAALRDAVGEDVEVKVIGEPGTGLAREDRFDWPARLADLAEDFPPAVLVLSLSSNDAQDLVDPNGDVVATMSDSDAWDEEYMRRLGEVFDLFEDTGTTVVWVGHVKTEDDGASTRNRYLQSLAEQVAADRDWVQVEDLAEIFGTGDEVATECLADDGLHLTVTCLNQAGEYLASTPPIATG